MSENKQTIDRLIWGLQERAKELNCLYKIEEVMNKPDSDIDEVCRGIIEAIPPGWQYPDICIARVKLGEKSYYSPGFEKTLWVQSANIQVQDKNVGEINVYYTKEMPRADDGPFLKEETKLLATIVDRLSHFIMYTRMKSVFQEYQSAKKDIIEHRASEWQVALNFLRQTDKNLYLNISRRMLNHLCWTGIDEAEQLLQDSGSGPRNEEIELEGDENRPYQKKTLSFTENLSEATFALASKYLTNAQILSNIQKWMQEARLNFLIQVANRNLPLPDLVDAIRRYHYIIPEGIELPPASKRSVQVSLLRRFLSGQPEFINIAKDYIEVDDFYYVLDRIVYPPGSHGRLGGKSTGLFLAHQIIKKTRRPEDNLEDIKLPKTWYLTSDVLFSFLSYNNLNEVVEQKYKDISQVRLEYPHIVQTFKNCNFPTEIVQGLSMILDDFKDKPIIVRSSSLLEDRAGAAFSGKYKSLFLANQGSKQERLAALTDAISEVYASVFGPDPIEYRAERGLLDFVEEMGIMIQEVVGTRIGDYYFPAYAGVVFSRNEFRWSPRIKQEDGLLRLVPGLGTRAVDRLCNDYPVLVAPRQTGLRVNVAVDEIVRYTPKRADVINLKTNSFDTVELKDLLSKCGKDIPNINKIISIYDGQVIRKPLGNEIDFEKDELVVTFEGLITKSDFIDKINRLTRILEEKLLAPVDIEFACDGTDFYLLQCRAQSYSEGVEPERIPKDIPANKLIFSANRYISNGRGPDITHIVYVDPQKYDELEDKSALVAVGRAVGSLNKLLPRKRFVLMGPGRWGSRGDIKMGVKVTYSEINNTAVLIEIARKKGNYIPEPSFGTHFFQDLVESGIRYLPLYPDDSGTVFNEDFFKKAKNMLPKILPDFAFLSDTVKVIDVAKNTGGLLFRVLMNAELDEAVGILSEKTIDSHTHFAHKDYREKKTENHWAWRMSAAEYIASNLDPERFGIHGFYVYGSTKNATAGPQSDIDILIHIRGTAQQRHDLKHWLEGWSMCLSEMNRIRTGYKTEGILDVQFVTDEDIAKKTSYALKIGAVTDAARPLPLMEKIND
ncbi:MAG: PEP/pyruvate-binding domain-containing protein [Candidatus Aminicenantes bacterium]|nr:PEP/pyruvate-binding domain-containing protein [Candidatus Aminicenantes bacterium]